MTAPRRPRRRRHDTDKPAHRWLPPYGWWDRLKQSIKRLIGPNPLDGASKIPRSKHQVSRDNISKNALKVLYRLNKAGYESHLVGGSVRDLLLRKAPKDFDVATNARPEVVRKLFRNSRTIGRRFKIVHILFGREIIEVATFRGESKKPKHEKQRTQNADGFITRDNVYGNIAEDAIRRDFTINALFYNVKDFSILDFAGGAKDLEQKTIRLIGNPTERYQEDPVRMLRAIRFATKLDFTIEPETAKPIQPLGSLLEPISPARLFDEMLKLLFRGQGRANFTALQTYDLLKYLFPDVATSIEDAEKQHHYQTTLELIDITLRNTDDRLNNGMHATPAFLCAAILWPAVYNQTQRLKTKYPLSVARQKAERVVLGRQTKSLMIPRRFTQMMRDMWQLQHRFHKRGFDAAERLLENPRFRAAYDLLLIRAESGEKAAKMPAEWWTQYHKLDINDREAMAEDHRRKSS